MAKDLFIDIETYSSVDIKTAGAYKYIDSDDFEIIIIGYAIDNGPVQTIDLLNGESIHDEFEEALFDDSCKKHAHNAVFERTAFKKIGYDIPIEQWYCTAVKAAYCGLPLSLDEVSNRLNLSDKKLKTGKLLINYFSCPCKPTRSNGFRTRNYPEHAPDKWEMYKEYNKYDVLAEREIYYTLLEYDIPDFERQLYILDQQINDRGILVDLELANSAISVDTEYSSILTNRAIELTSISNPNSPTQIKNWIKMRTGETVDSLAASSIDSLIKQFSEYQDIVELLEIRKKLSRSSVKKYYAMTNCAMRDNRVRGTFQFYGANRTGRWAGRLLQLQNLSKNHISNIDEVRQLIRERDWHTVELLYDDVSDILSQLVRTALIAPENKTFCVADFSAIEARVVSWLADEEWRLDVFRGDGKIYEAAGARMFNVPIETITKGSDLRAKAKNAELALGYGGSLGAMKRMGGDKMGMSDTEMISIVHKWRKANKKIVEVWDEIQDCAYSAVRSRKTIIGTPRKIEFKCDGEYLMIKLPSSHTLFYRHPLFKHKSVGRTEVEQLFYEGVIQETKQWGYIDTYGGKLTENIVQAISRDILGFAMINLSRAGYDITMHVHDEVIAEIPSNENEQTAYNKMIEIMSTSPSWASDLPLNADGYITKFYKKD